MTIKTIRFGGTDFTDGEVLPAADQNDTFDETKQNFINIYPVLNDVGFVVGHSSDTASYSDVSVGIFQTTDYTSVTISWTSRNTNILQINGVMGVNCKADRTKAIALEKTTGDGAFTSNSGGTWSDSSTNPPNVTILYDISCPTTGLAVAFGDNSGAGENIWVSTDGGNNWAEVSDDGGVGAAGVGAGDMFDGTTGFCMPVNTGDIFITSDSADTWADTTRNLPVTITTNDTMFAVSATVYLIAVIEDGIYKGTTSADPTRVSFIPSGYSPTRFVKTTNGEIYVLWLFRGADDTSTKPLILCKSTDNGDTWTQSTIYMGYHDTTNTQHSKASLSEAGDNKLIFATSTGNGVASSIIEIDVS